MDRNEKIRRVSSRGHVFQITHLEVIPSLIHDKYTWTKSDGAIGKTGLLELLSITPKEGEQGPHFRAHWDQNAQHLDIDMYEASNGAISDFKNRRNGYAGHHTDKTVDPDKAVFDVRIEIPDGPVFAGTVSFSKHHKLPVKAGVIKLRAQPLTLEVKRNEAST